MNRIKELRIKRGLTQSELAQMLNIAQNTLSYWETGKTEPNGVRRAPQGQARPKMGDKMGDKKIR